MKRTIIFLLFILPYLGAAQENNALRNIISFEAGKSIFGAGDHWGIGLGMAYTRDISKWLDFNANWGVTHASDFSAPKESIQNYSVTSLYALLGPGIKPIRIGNDFALKLTLGLAPKFSSSVRDASRRDYKTEDGTRIIVINQKTYTGFDLSYYSDAQFQFSLEKYRVAFGARIIGEPEYNSIFYLQIGLRF